VRSALTHAAPVPSALLAPLAVALPRTLDRPISVTRGILSHTVAGLTPATTALAQMVGTVSHTVGVPPGAPAGLRPLIRTAGAGEPAASSALALEPGTNADRSPAVAAPPLTVGGVVRDPAPGEFTSVTTPGLPRASWPTLDVGVGPASKRAVPGVPAPWDPVAPEAPAGSAGAVGGGASVLTGVLADPLAVAAILTVLVLLACGRRWAWWFPEVAIGPD
jgi:hypothetical protein